MNERNVKAVATAIMGYIRARGYIDLGFHDANVESCSPLARYLASEGVLVPSALTDEDCERAQTVWSNEWPEHVEGVPPVLLRQKLERIAKGEDERNRADYSETGTEDRE